MGGEGKGEGPLRSMLQSFFTRVLPHGELNQGGHFDTEVNFFPRSGGEGRVNRLNLLRRPPPEQACLISRAREAASGLHASGS
jgi:hypothetical protein